MAYEPPQQNGNGAGPTPEQQAEKLVEELLGGEIPGTGYLFPMSPTDRANALIETTPDQVRAWLLRAIETTAISANLPFGAEKKGELGRVALEFAQAYLLLDPAVDNEGVEVGPKREHEAEMKSHEADLQARTAAHASGERFDHPETESGYKEPPRVKPPPAAEAVKRKNQNKAEINRGARGSKPTPRAGK